MLSKTQTDLPGVTVILFRSGMDMTAWQYFISGGAQLVVSFSMCNLLKKRTENDKKKTKNLKSQWNSPPLCFFFSSGDVSGDKVHDSFTVLLNIVMDLATLHSFMELFYEFFHGGELNNCVTASDDLSLYLSPWGMTTSASPEATKAEPELAPPSIFPI